MKKIKKLKEHCSKSQCSHCTKEIECEDLWEEIENVVNLPVIPEQWTDEDMKRIKEITKSSDIKTD